MTRRFLLLLLLLLPASAWALSGTANQITVQNGTVAFTNVPIRVNEGGTGATTLTIHGVLMGQTQSAISASAAGTSGQAFISGGAGADGAYGDLGVAHGGTGATTLTIHGVLMGQTTAAISASAAGTSGQAFLSGGAGADGAYGDLGVAHGGTGATTLGAHGVLIGETTSAIVSVGGTGGVCTSGQVLTCNSNGTADPSFQTAATGITPLIAFGTNGDITQATTVWASPAATDISEARTQISPVNGVTIKNLRCFSSVVPGTSQTYTITMTSGTCTGALTASTDQVCTITAAVQSCTASPNAGQAVTALACFSFKIVSSATAATGVVNCTAERTA